jgi:hypothetical protein
MVSAILAQAVRKGEAAIIAFLKGTSSVGRWLGGPGDIEIGHSDPESG